MLFAIEVKIKTSRSPRHRHPWKASLLLSHAVIKRLALNIRNKMKPSKISIVCHYRPRTNPLCLIARMNWGISAVMSSVATVGGPFGQFAVGNCMTWSTIRGGVRSTIVTRVLLSAGILRSTQADLDDRRTFRRGRYVQFLHSLVQNLQVFVEPILDSFVPSRIPEGCTREALTPKDAFTKKPALSAYNLSSGSGCGKGTPHATTCSTWNGWGLQRA